MKKSSERSGKGRSTYQLMSAILIAISAVSLVMICVVIGLRIRDPKAFDEPFAELMMLILSITSAVVSMTSSAIAFYVTCRSQKRHMPSASLDTTSKATDRLWNRIQTEIAELDESSERTVDRRAMAAKLKGIEDMISVIRSGIKYTADDLEGLINLDFAQIERV